MTSPVFERVRGIAADVLKLPANQITAYSSPENIENWGLGAAPEGRNSNSPTYKTPMRQ